MVRSKTMTDKFGEIALVVLLSAIALGSLAPIWHTFAVSFSDKASAAAGFVTFWPKGFNVYSYEKILDDPAFLNAFLTSVKRVLLGGAIQFLLTVLMAYPLSREPKEFRLRNGYMWFLVFTMLFSGGIIPLYIVVKSLGLFNSIWSLVLPGAVPVFNVILLMNFFRSIPKELNEAGYMDGAGPWFTLFRIYVPLSAPALATVTLFSVVGHWNAFFDGMIFMRSVELYPLQTYIQQLVVQLNVTQLANDPNKLDMLAKLSNKTLNAAKIAVSMIPILLVYPFLQKYFIHGIMLGSVKE
ncbi:carbohydrate ABC transporter permease [Paenibacillus flagellatus]|uniref:ABC transporter permease n=1 Tax=Paenibacillus flagellatus TaxID=2211139 RepID=A0A2V5K6G9_9BACL|nr:carbohydrate ABC transporter permease [Paenibacillus flagellatus]PYI54985.1 ABC transporter permease [Paenibacillus flagellatus]